MEPLRKGDPAQIGPFAIAARLGAGGMGQVFLGQRDGRVVAVKVLATDLVGSSDVRTRFAREAKALAEIRSPFVSPIIDSDTSGTAAWLSIAFVPGQNLNQHNMTSGMSESEWFETLVCCLLALCSVHDLGIIHRDIKPGNIIFSPNGPQLIDFGIAQSLDETALTQAGGHAGSPIWLSPDVFSEEPLTGKTDVFSLASTLVFAATGASPWGSPHKMTIPNALRKITSGEPGDTQGVPVRAQNLLDAMLQKHKPSRPDARNALEQALPLLSDESMKRIQHWIQLAALDGRAIPTDLDPLLRASFASRGITQPSSPDMSPAEGVIQSAQTRAQRLLEMTAAESERLRKKAHADADKIRAEAEAIGVNYHAKLQRLQQRESLRARLRALFSGQDEQAGKNRQRAFVAGAAGFVIAALSTSGVFITIASSEIDEGAAVLESSSVTEVSEESETSAPRRVPASVLPSNGSLFPLGEQVTIALEPGNSAVSTIAPVFAEFSVINSTGEPNVSCGERTTLPWNQETRRYEIDCEFSDQGRYRVHITWTVGGAPSADRWDNQYEVLVSSFSITEPSDQSSSTSGGLDDARPNAADDEDGPTSENVIPNDQRAAALQAAESTPWPTAEPLIEIPGTGDYVAHRLTLDGNVVRILAWVHPEWQREVTEFWFLLENQNQVGIPGQCGSKIQLSKFDLPATDGFSSVWEGTCRIENLAVLSEGVVQYRFHQTYTTLGHEYLDPVNFGRTYSLWNTDWRVVTDFVDEYGR